MQNNEILQQLKQLYDTLIVFDSTKIELASAKQALSDISTKPLTAVSDYDSQHKSEYIVSRIGKEPKKPNKALIIAVPVYIKKKKEYERK